MTAENPVRILHVDDDELDVAALARALRKSDAPSEIVVAKDGIEALEILRADDEPPSKRPFTVLLDLNMPRMNGHEFLQEMGADPKLRSTVVFLLTTSLAESDVLEAHDFNVAATSPRRAQVDSSKT